MKPLFVTLVLVSLSSFADFKNLKPSKVEMPPMPKAPEVNPPATSPSENAFVKAAEVRPKEIQTLKGKDKTVRIIPGPNGNRYSVIEKNGKMVSGLTDLDLQAKYPDLYALVQRQAASISK